MIEVGTRTRTTRLNAASDQGRQTRFFTPDLGMAKIATVAVTFGASGAVGPAGCFAAFAPGDVVRIEGTNANNGYQAIETVTNGNTITGDKGFVAESVTATIRTA